MCSIQARCGIRRLAAACALGLCLSIAKGGTDDRTLYDPDPKHLWNRLNETLFVRTGASEERLGSGRLDILYWHNTRHLLEQPSHRQALAVLDEFLNTHGEKLVRDPLPRALLQH